jgi:hypothetical protein
VLVVVRGVVGIAVHQGTHGEGADLGRVEEGEGRRGEGRVDERRADEMRGMQSRMPERRRTMESAVIAM